MRPTRAAAGRQRAREGPHPRRRHLPDPFDGGAAADWVEEAVDHALQDTWGDAEEEEEPEDGGFEPEDPDEEEAVDGGVEPGGDEYGLDSDAAVSSEEEPSGEEEVKEEEESSGEDPS